MVRRIHSLGLAVAPISGHLPARQLSGRNHRRHDHPRLHGYRNGTRGLYLDGSGKSVSIMGVDAPSALVRAGHATENNAAWPVTPNSDPISRNARSPSNAPSYLNRFSSWVYVHLMRDR